MHRSLSDVVQFALEILDEIEHAGLTLVPIEPTPEMVTAASAVAGLDEDTARTVYRAMVENS